MLNIGNKVYRNLQEQVGYNTECIKKLDEYLDGIKIEDKLVVIENDSGTFSDEELLVLSGPLAFISDGSKVWMKQSETLLEFVFKAIDISATEQGGTYYNIGGSKIVINRETGIYNTSSDTIIEIYNKSQMDALLADKADTTAMTTALAGKADISGANFTGPITSPSIIESMSGYTITNGSPTYITPVYGGAVKNGNKLTLVYAFTVNKGDSGTGNPNLCYINLPSAVASKLFPWTGNLLEMLVVPCFKTQWSKVDMQVSVSKYSNQLLLQLFNIASLDANTDYYGRIELTYLLSDSLVS